MEKTLPVSAIKNGTVIDHIKCGSALKILLFLQLAKHQNQVTVGLNLTSRKLTVKDLIKVENRFLTEKETHDIAVFAPDATISLIKNYKVEKKMIATLPSCVEKILICPNPRCITKVEAMDSCFFVEEYKHKIHLKCKYCEKVFQREEIEDR